MERSRYQDFRIFSGGWQQIAGPVILVGLWTGVCYLAFKALVGYHRGIESLSPFLLILYDESNFFGLALVQSFMAVNVLLAVYLWVSFRSLRRELGDGWRLRYTIFVAATLLLLYLHVALVNADQWRPDVRLLPFPPSHPGAIPDPTPWD